MCDLIVYCWHPKIVFLFSLPPPLPSSQSMVPLVVVLQTLLTMETHPEVDGASTHRGGAQTHDDVIR